MFLIIAGCIWVGLATIFVLALVCAASRRVPPPSSELAQSTEVEVNTRHSTLTQRLAREDKEIDPVLDV